MRHRLLRAAAVCLVLALPLGGASANDVTAGSAGIGDPYFPQAGNGGYDVDHYSIRVTYRPSTGRLTGRTRITAHATQTLTRFNLDLVLGASKVLVNGQPASFTRGPHELVVRPDSPLSPGQPFGVTVQYSGFPARHKDMTTWPTTPWTRTRDGAAAIGEPAIAAWWFPSNDHPRDKATFDIGVRVPRGLQAISNGYLVSNRRQGRMREWLWRMDSPMATYLADFVAGHLRIRRWRADGLQVLIAAPAQPRTRSLRLLRHLSRTPEVVRWESRQFGPYPFRQTGGVIADAPDLYFALENQTRPVYPPNLFGYTGGIDVMVHELAHQWFGNDVSVHSWRDIWLNEGLATFAEWLWREQHGGVSGPRNLSQEYRLHDAGDYFWKLKIADPRPRMLFDQAVYERGAMTVQALRNRVGNATFFQILRTWVREHAGSDASTGQFIALAERLSRQDLSSFFQHWLATPSRPANTPENGLGNTPG